MVKASFELVPVRVDVLSDDKTIRVVDTLLFDPTCWPITLHEPLHISVEENVIHIAHTILSDAEVQGMTKTSRHFTGRVDIWSNQLQKGIEDQLRPQLWKIAEVNGSETSRSEESLIPVSIRLMVGKINVHENILWDKRGPISPIEFAQDMACELNLPDEAAVSIAMTISEQLHGMPIDTTIDSASPDKDTNATYRGAWATTDPKEHSSSVAQIVAQHRSI